MTSVVSSPPPDSGNLKAHLVLLSKTADSISDGDLVDRQIRSRQNWSLLPTQVKATLGNWHTHRCENGPAASAVSTRLQTLMSFGLFGFLDFFFFFASEKSQTTVC